MQKKVIMNSAKVLLPIALLSLLLSFLLLLISDFGFLYLFKQPIPLDDANISDLQGLYAIVEVANMEGTYARFGASAADDDPNPEIIERYCVYKFADEQFIGVRIMGDALEQIDNLQRALEAFSIDEVRNMDFGSLSGTVNPAPDDLYEYLCRWIDDSVLADNTFIVNPYTTKTTEQQAEELAQKQRYYDEHVNPFILEVGFYGSFPAPIVWLLSIPALILLLLAILILLSIPLGFWFLPIKRLSASVGSDSLNDDFLSGKNITNNLRICKNYIWLFYKIKSDCVKTSDVIWAYPRSKRLEGGKLNWSLVLKTADKREYAISLGSSESVQAAINEIKSLGSPLSSGYDKEKQKLYDKNIAAFLALIKNECSPPLSAED